jgi:hypothetical protein
MGFFDFIVKPFAFVFNVITFGKINSEKLINDAIGIALGVTKISTVVDVAQSAIGVEVLPPSITKTKALGKLTDDLGLGSTIIGKAVHLQEDIALANIIKDKVKNVVHQKKDEWMDEMKGMKFHNEGEVKEEINRRVLQEKSNIETNIRINKKVEEMATTKQAFMVISPEKLEPEAKKKYETYQKDIAQQQRDQRILEDKISEDKRYNADKQKFVNDFIIGKKTVEPWKMGWFNQMKSYYKV